MLGIRGTVDVRALSRQALTMNLLVGHTVPGAGGLGGLQGDRTGPAKVP
jgi:hypothetical protein